MLQRLRSRKGFALGDATIGIILILCSSFLISTLDTTSKYLARDYPVPMVIWSRYFFHLLIFGLPTLVRFRWQAVRTERFGLHVVRAALLVAVTALFVSALTLIPQAEATAISFVHPILLTVLSVTLLGERAGPWNWGAVVVGFLGVLIIIRPGIAAVSTGALFALGMAGCYAFYQIATRSLNKTESSITTLFYTAAVGTFLTSLAVPFYWTTPTDLFVWSLMVLMGLLGGFGHFLLILALRYASPTIIAPFFYVQLLIASVNGYLIFGDVPDEWTAAGAVLIAGAGLVIWSRERQRGATTATAK